MGCFISKTSCDSHLPMSHLTWSPRVAPPRARILRGSHEKLWPKAAAKNDTQLLMPEILDLLRLFVKSFTIGFDRSKVVRDFRQ